MPCGIQQVLILLFSSILVSTNSSQAATFSTMSLSLSFVAGQVAHTQWTYQSSLAENSCLL